MNKFNFFTCSLLLFNSYLCGKLDVNRPEAKPTIELSRLRNAIRTIGDFFGNEALGFQALLPHNQYFIEAIITELDMQDYCIEIRGMSNFAQALFGRTNAFVVPSCFGQKFHAFLFISEDWFESLSEESKEALVKHELMHLKHNHVAKKAIFSWASALSFLALKKLIINPVFDLNNPDFMRRKDLKAINACAFFMCLLGWVLVDAKFSRFIEHEADIEAAKTMNHTEGFVDLFTNIKENTRDPYSRFTVKRFLQKIDDFFGSYFSTHPDLDERIEYMKNFKCIA
ncbi:MAG: heat shock protein HtpX [Candidatus Dependentiae bacterium ADurb.Bin331]|nr:MAG: heat shock protein HtpX [Candidatus Dependentiae bacterium ADurb.Bin331]